jgi:hypothetical protein
MDLRAILRKVHQATRSIESLENSHLDGGFHCAIPRDLVAKSRYGDADACERPNNERNDGNAAGRCDREQHRDQQGQETANVDV